MYVKAAALDEHRTGETTAYGRRITNTFTILDASTSGFELAPRDPPVN